MDFDEEALVAGFKSWFGGILCLAWSPDGRYIVTGGEVRNGSTLTYMLLAPVSFRVAFPSVLCFTVTVGEVRDGFTVTCCWRLCRFELPFRVSFNCPVLNHYRRRDDKRLQFRVTGAWVVSSCGGGCLFTVLCSIVTGGEMRIGYSYMLPFRVYCSFKCRFGLIVPGDESTFFGPVFGGQKTTS